MGEYRTITLTDPEATDPVTGKTATELLQTVADVHRTILSYKSVAREARARARDLRLWGSREGAQRERQRAKRYSDFARALEQAALIKRLQEAHNGDKNG